MEKKIIEIGDAPVISVKVPRRIIRSFIRLLERIAKQPSSPIKSYQVVDHQKDKALRAEHFFYEIRYVTSIDKINIEDLIQDRYEAQGYYIKFS